MADKRIKGITIEIGGETTGLQKALADVNKKSRDIQSELKQVDRLLKFDPGNTELLAQKQQLLAEHVENTSEKLRRLKEAQAQVEEQFRRGEIGADQYRAFQRELITTESQLNHYKNKLQEVEKQQKEAGNSLQQLSKKAEEVGESFKKAGDKMKEVGSTLTTSVSGPLAALGAGALYVASDFESSAARIQNSLGITAEEAQKLSDIGKDIYNRGFGESLEEIERALIQVKQNIQGLTNEELSDVITKAQVLGQTFDADVNEVTRAASNIMKGFGLSAQEAFDLMAHGAQNGLNFSNEMFDNLSEYSTLFAEMGFSAEEYFQLLEKGTKAGVYNLDYVNDVMKEFQIRVKDGSKSTSDAMAELSAETNKVWESFLKGESTVKDVHNAVISELKNMDDQVKANQIGVALYGTKWEDLEATAMYAMSDINGALENVKGSMDTMVDVQEQTFGQRFQSMLRELKSALEPLGKVLLDMANQWLPKISKAVEIVSNWFSNLSPTIQNLIVVIGAIVMAIGPVLVALGAITSSIGALMPVISSLIGFIAGGGGLAAAFSALTGPIGIAIAAITAAISISVALYKNWDQVKGFLTKTWDAIANAASKIFNSIKDFFAKWGPDILAVLTGPIGILVKAIIENWDKIKSITNQVWESIKSSTSNVANGIKNIVSDTWNNIKSVTQSVWNGIKTAIINPIESARNTLFNIIDRIKSAFANLKITIPKPKLPHIDVNWKSFGVGDAKIKIPTFDINWYARGGIFNSPSIIGVGEAGKEAVVPLEGNHMKPFAEEIARQMSKFTGGINSQIVVPVYLDGYEIARAVYPHVDNMQGTAIQANNRYSGVK